MQEEAEGARGPAKQRRERGQLAICFSIMVLASVLRLAILDLRPPHHDEGVNGYLAHSITSEHPYRYNASVGHGPLFFYVVRAGEIFIGKTLIGLRVPAALFSIATVGLCFLFHPWLGKSGANIAALMTALSPGFTFVGKTAIHESTLGFFLLLMLWGAMRLADAPDFRGRLALTLGLAGSLATKETIVIHVAALLVSWTLCRRRRGLHAVRSERRSVLPQSVLLGAGVLLVLWGLYTGGGKYPEGWHALFAGFTNSLRTGISEHTKPWWYWFYVLAVSDPLLLLTGVLAPFLLRSAKSGIQLCGWFSILAPAAYFLIPYKTPWCMASLAVSWPIAGGFMFGTSTSLPVSRIVSWCGTAILGVTLYMNLHLNFWAHSDPRQPHVYVATSPEISRVLEIMRRHAADIPRGNEVRGRIFLPDPHPLPWILDAFPCIDYVPPRIRPRLYDTGLIVADESRLAEIETHISLNSYYRVPIRLRLEEAPCVFFFHRAVFREL